MAKGKSEDTVENVENVAKEEAQAPHEEAVQAPHQPYDPWKDMRTVFIPKRSRGEQNTLEVGVNDRTFFIPKDRMAEVPAPIWEVIEEKLRQERELEEYLASNENLTPSRGKE